MTNPHIKRVNLESTKFYEEYYSHVPNDILKNMIEECEDGIQIIEAKKLALNNILISRKNEVKK